MSAPHPSDTFARAADLHGLTAQELATAGGYDHRTGNRLMGGDQLPSLEAFRRMVSRASRLPLAVKRDLLAWQLDGSSFAAVERDAPCDADQDFNRDGRCDAKDLPAGAGQLMQRVGHWLELAGQGHVFTGDQAAAARADLSEVRRIVGGLEALVDRLTAGPRAAG